MNAIKIIRGCGASGKSLVAGAVYSVPGEVSEADAEILVKILKAERIAVEIPAPNNSPRKTKKS